MYNEQTYMSHLPWIDGVRFIAAFMVLLCHARCDFFLPYYLLPNDQQGFFSFVFYFCSRLGDEAVIVFFVLSGFLVGGRGLERMISHKFDKKTYIIDRTVRIGIPLIAAIIFCYFTFRLIGRDFNYWTAVGNLFSLQGIFCESLISPFWSLSYEVWFYIFLFGISLVISKNNTGIILLLVCCLVFTRLNPVYLLIWFMGAFSYLSRPQIYKRWVFILSLVLIMICSFLCAISSESHISFVDLKPEQNVARFCLAISVCIFLQQIVLCRPRKKISKQIERCFSYLAGFSYTLYLTHRITLLLIEHFVLPMGKAQLNCKGIMSFFIILVTCLTVGWLIYLISERKTGTIKVAIKQLTKNIQV